MDVLTNLGLGFSVALAPMNLLYGFLGVLLGTVIGVLPGLGPVATISILLPFTFSLQPQAALIMLAGIYYGAQYGGSTTAILVNLPGESSSVVTAIDGNQMARQGKAGLALATAALASFMAGTFATFVIALAAPALAEVALQVRAGRLFLADGVRPGRRGDPRARLGAEGGRHDPRRHAARHGRHRRQHQRAALHLRRPQFGDGMDFAVIAMGIFGIGETIVNLERTARHAIYMQTRQEPVAEAAGAARDAAAGLPRHVARLGARHPAGRRAGAGLVLGLCAGEEDLRASRSGSARARSRAWPGPEAANNGAAQTSFIPLLTLGLPANAVMALMIGALMMHGLHPGPQLMRDKPELFWGLVASMWTGNLMLVILNLPLVGIWAKLLTLPYRFLYPAILLICCIGVYSINNSALDVLIATVFGFIGYLLYRLDCEPAPLLLGFILGPLIEENLRRALRHLARRSERVRAAPDQLHVPGPDRGADRRARRTGDPLRPRARVQGNLRCAASRLGMPRQSVIAVAQDGSTP